MKERGETIQCMELYDVFPRTISGVWQPFVTIAPLGSPLEGQVVLHEEQVGTHVHTLTHRDKLVWATQLWLDQIQRIWGSVTVDFHYMNVAFIVNVFTIWQFNQTALNELFNEKWGLGIASGSMALCWLVTPWIVKCSLGHVRGDMFHCLTICLYIFAMLSSRRKVQYCSRGYQSSIISFSTADYIPKMDISIMMPPTDVKSTLSLSTQIKIMLTYTAKKQGRGGSGSTQCFWLWPMTYDFTETCADSPALCSWIGIYLRTPEMTGLSLVTCHSLLRQFSVYHSGKSTIRVGLTASCCGESLSVWHSNENLSEKTHTL